MRRVKEDMDSGSDAEGIVQCTLDLHDHLSCIQSHTSIDIKS